MTVPTPTTGRTTRSSPESTSTTPKPSSAIEKEIAGGQINELSLDIENRRAVWEADVSTGSEQRSVQIDAGNGDVVSNRIDD